MELAQARRRAGPFIVVALLYGFERIASAAATVKLVAQQIGEENVGLVSGWIFAARQLRAAAVVGADGVRTSMRTSHRARCGAACIVCIEEH
ncbi:MAG: hypothetical protein JWP59_1590 [Massilia sp.]|jgi:hypothetical protein|nr:hypothetical protein [Massilia sp.]